MEFLFGLLDNPLVLGAVGIAGLLFAYRFVADRVKMRVPGSATHGRGRREPALRRRWGEKKRRRGRSPGSGRAATTSPPASCSRRAASCPRPPRPTSRGRSTGPRRPPSRGWGAPSAPPSSTCRPATTRRAPRCSRPPASRRRPRRCSSRRATTSRPRGCSGSPAQWTTAAELYEKSGYPLRAAEAWDKDGKPLKAAEAYEKHFIENVSYYHGYASTAAPAAEQKSARHGRRALRAVRPAGPRGQRSTARAASTARRPRRCCGSGSRLKAAELFLRAEDDETRGRGVRPGRRDALRAAMLRGEAAFKADRPAEAAAFLREAARLPALRRAVRVGGMIARRGRRLRAGESWAAAGGVYLRAGLKDRGRRVREGGRARDGRGASSRSSATCAAPASSSAARASLQEPARPRRSPATASRRSRCCSGWRPRTRPTAARRSCSRGSSSRPAARRWPIERVRKAIGARPMSPREPRPVLLARASRTRPPARAARRSPLYEQMQAEDLHFRDVAASGWRGCRGRRRCGPSRPPRPAAAGTRCAPRPAAAPARAAPAVAPAARRPRRSRERPRGRASCRARRSAAAPLGVVHRGEDTTDGRSVAHAPPPRELLAGDGLPRRSPRT